MFSAPRFWRPKSSSGASSFWPLGSYSRPMASSRPCPSASLKNRPAVRASVTSWATAWPGPDLPTADGSAPSYPATASSVMTQHYGIVSEANSAISAPGDLIDFQLVRRG